MRFCPSHLHNNLSNHGGWDADSQPSWGSSFGPYGGCRTIDAWLYEFSESARLLLMDPFRCRAKNDKVRKLRIQRTQNFTWKDSETENPCWARKRGDVFVLMGMKFTMLDCSLSLSLDIDDFLLILFYQLDGWSIDYSLEFTIHWVYIGIESHSIVHCNDSWWGVWIRGKLSFKNSGLTTTLLTEYIKWKKCDPTRNSSVSLYAWYAKMPSWCNEIPLISNHCNSLQAD